MPSLRSPSKLVADVGWKLLIQCLGLPPHHTRGLLWCFLRGEPDGKWFLLEVGDTENHLCGKSNRDGPVLNVHATPVSVLRDSYKNNNLSSTS